jgi:RHS repeat-associated protein
MYDMAMYAYDNAGNTSETQAYYRARYYDGTTGRFISEDPLGFKAGINYYRYVRNNPANFTDPKGLYELRGFPAAEAAQMSIAIGPEVMEIHWTLSGVILLAGAVGQS